MSLPAFQAFQRDFGLYLRDPRRAPKPEGVPDRRAGVYRELLFNNVNGVIEICFPISRRILGEVRWQKLMETFFAEWRSQSPLFCELSREFLRWLNESEKLPVSLPAFLLELAHYEWAELAVDIMQTQPLPAFESEGDLLQGRPLVAPAHLVLSYQWAVHRIGPDYKPRKPVATQLVVFRNQDERVQFASINPVTARLLALLASGEMTGEAACLQVAQELQHPQPATVVAGGINMMNDLKNWGVIFGAIS
jgi:uncharacterized protein